MSETRATFRPPISILSYHQTDWVPRRGTPYRGLVLSPARFARQMRALHRLGWRGLSMRDLEPYLRGQKQGKVVGITLDDGYANNFEHALPVLRELGFTATSFVVSRQIGGTNLWDRALGVPAKPLMDLAQLRAWMDAGMEVGAHTCNHVDLAACDPGRAREEIVRSKHELEQALGTEIRSFCYPYGRYRSEHVEMVRSAGYALATTSESLRARWDADLLELPRVSVWLSTALPVLLAKIGTDIEHWRRQPSLQAALSRWMAWQPRFKEHRSVPEHHAPERRPAPAVHPRKPLA